MHYVRIRGIMHYGLGLLAEGGFSEFPFSKKTVPSNYNVKELWDSSDVTPCLLSINDEWEVKQHL